MQAASVRCLSGRKHIARQRAAVVLRARVVLRVLVSSSLFLFVVCRVQVEGAGEQAPSESCVLGACVRGVVRREGRSVITTGGVRAPEQ
jgi:hypothetical protein